MPVAPWMSRGRSPPLRCWHRPLRMLPNAGLNKPGCCEWAARAGRVAFAAEEIRFALDSALEGDGFEPSVPRGETLFSNRLINGSAQCTTSSVIAATTKCSMWRHLNRETAPVRLVSRALHQKLLEIKAIPSSVPARESWALYRKAARHLRTPASRRPDTLSSDNDPTSLQMHRCHETRTNQPTIWAQ
jgi:hypothetical protein